MRRRLAGLLVVVIAVFGGVVAQPASAAAAHRPAAAAAAPQHPMTDGGGRAIGGICRLGSAPILGAILGEVGKLGGSLLCDKVGDATAKKIKEEWNNVWHSVIGDVINSAVDCAKWMIRRVLTVALMGPSVDLAGTGLFGRDATLSGMLVWLGLVIAAAGIIWNTGKMAITGQIRHLGRAAAGWAENVLLSAVGITMFALLLEISDKISEGLVKTTFANDGQAYERIVAVMLPQTISNPVIVGGVVVALLLIGFIQLVMVFLRQSAVPIICLLLPVAGAGRTGGDVTRQWAPKLITAGMVVVAYKPMLAVIVCAGFAEFGHAQTLAEWLRGFATLVLAVVAPGPLMRIFAPFSEAVGNGMASGGASGALGAAAGYIGGRGAEGGRGGDGANAPTDAVKHAQYVQQSMGRQGGSGGEQGSEAAGRDAQTQAARNDAAARVPDQKGPKGPPGAPGPEGAGGQAGVGGQAAAHSGTAGAGNTGGGGGGAAGGIAVGVKILDGINDGVQGASRSVGGNRE
ncbi:hypothetical protein [Streptomyces sp. NRRL S-87]|uniref:hypothetical protein n=1 Tax=Streptomyces sp. NRRL S-87 TaxID=1463920 RepID=UPI000AFBDE42|nr:hypothetical protein [Streptomyces sp. NRRL S-87]